MRVFLDANILFSAAKSDGAVRHLLIDLRGAGHDCVADGYVIGEARRNLETKYCDAVVDLDRLLETLSIVGHAPVPGSAEGLLALPEKDRPVLASAIHHRCQALLTGDRTHFGALYGQAIAGVTIHSPQSIAGEF